MAEALLLSTETSCLQIRGGLAITEFRKVTAALHNLIDMRGYKDITLDFGNCTFVHAPPMVAIICDCLRYRTLGVDFSLVVPPDGALSRLFHNSNWAHLIDPIKFAESSHIQGKHNPATRFSTTEQQGLIVDAVMDTLLASIKGFSRPHLKAIEWSLNEITDNVLVHAEAAAGGVVQVTALKNRKRVEIVVGDCGIGVAASLRNHRPKLTSDVEALSKAIEEGVTRDQQLGQGNGLYGTYRIAVSGSGTFSMHSNSATLYYTELTGTHSKSEQVPFSP